MTLVSLTAYLLFCSSVGERADIFGKQITFKKFVTGLKDSTALAGLGGKGFKQTVTRWGKGVKPKSDFTTPKISFQQSH